VSYVIRAHLRLKRSDAGWLLQDGGRASPLRLPREAKSFG